MRIQDASHVFMTVDRNGTADRLWRITYEQDNNVGQIVWTSARGYVTITQDDNLFTDSTYVRVTVKDLDDDVGQ